MCEREGVRLRRKEVGKGGDQVPESVGGGVVRASMHEARNGQDPPAHLRSRGPPVEHGRAAREDVDEG